VPAFTFEPLLNGLESTECVGLREELFKRQWAKTEETIQVGMNSSLYEAILVLKNAAVYFRQIK
jgi:hypothetical protein